MQSMDGMNFSNAYHEMSSFNIESKLTANLQNYEKTIEQIKKRQDLFEQSTSTQLKSNRNGSRRDSPPPMAPSMHLQHETDSAPPPPNIKTTAYAARGAYHQAARKQEQQPTAPRLSFTIKRPVKVDKFGLLRIATPLGSNNDDNSPTKSYSRSRSRSKSRHTNRRSRSHDSYSKTSRNYRHRNGSNSSRSSSVERSRRRQRRSHSRRYNRSRSRSPKGRGGRRRTPSPFVPRGTPPRRRSRSTRRSRSRNRSRSPNRSRGGRSNSGRQSPRSAYGNRVWRRPGYTPGEMPPIRSSNSRWQHDKFEEVDQEKIDDGPTIEEIDKIINKAQKERKEEIIKRDKDILKKPTA